MSTPPSHSLLISGFRFRLPSVVSVRTTPPPMLNVSYWAVNRGELPAVPYDPRSLNSLTIGRNQNGSLLTRHAADMRPKVPHRLPAPNRELPAFRTSPSRIYRSLNSNPPPPKTPIWRTRW